MGLDTPANRGDELEDFDLFSSGGGMELEGDDCLGVGQGNSDIVRASNVSIVGGHPYSEHPSRTHFLRNINSNVEDSELKALFEGNPSEKDVNQGMLVVFNLDTSVSTNELQQIFGVFGEIKEIHDTSPQQNDKFIEFYDVRAAEAALCALNRCDISRKQIKIEQSPPGGQYYHLPAVFSFLFHCFREVDSSF
ncbi:hypothetical protein SLEP1_g56916 [Rubroshorea leprosula]|uniref:RRM domain-containing protein n=1 Tax=Rubroshorea leprosula TaxID=152421 RepID=A0AAV5MM32_9ROSI|nr:hypothetical protein SLEP1_g56916 [Rubroshorea leprosula]